MRSKIQYCKTPLKGNTSCYSRPSKDSENNKGSIKKLIIMNLYSIHLCHWNLLLDIPNYYSNTLHGFREALMLLSLVMPPWLIIGLSMSKESNLFLYCLVILKTLSTDHEYCCCPYFPSHCAFHSSLNLASRPLAVPLDHLNIFQCVLNMGILFLLANPVWSLWYLFSLSHVSLLSIFQAASLWNEVRVMLLYEEETTTAQKVTVQSNKAVKMFQVH